MSAEEAKIPVSPAVDDTIIKAAEVPARKAMRSVRAPYRGGGGRGRQTEKDDFDQKMIDLARVTRVMAGGKRMRFRACIVIGDHKGKIGWAVAKGADVSLAINKAASKARKNLVTVRAYKGTIPHPIEVKYKAARVMIKPAKLGSGIKAGGAVRAVLELSGIENISAKILGSSNKINNVRATFKALTSLKYGARLEDNDNEQKTVKHSN